MPTKTTRRLALFALLLGVVAIVRTWPDQSSGQPESPRPLPTDAGQSVAVPSRADSTAPTSIPVDPVGAAAGSPAAPNAMEASRRVNGAPVRLQVHAPADVHSGDVFQVRIDIEANGGVREVMLAVTYDMSHLALVGWSEGDFAQQGGVQAELGAQEPSDGNIEVMFSVARGLSVAGAGSMAVLQFEAIKPGTSRVALRDIMATDRSGDTNVNIAVVREGSVTIH